MGRYAGIILALAVFAASLVWLARGVHVDGGGEDAPPFHLDEAHKIGEAYYYHLFFEQRDLHHPAWTEDFYARINPPVGKYIFGGVLAAAGHPVRDQRLQAAFNTRWREPKTLRGYVSDEMLRITRGTSIVFGAALCVLLFIIGRRAAGTVAGLIAAVLLLGNPLFVRYAQRGLTDTILLFHLTLIVPVTLVSVGILRRHWQGRLAGGTARRWGVLVLMTILVPAVAIALATGSKLNGGLAGPAYAGGLFLGALFCASPRPVWRRVALACGVTVLTAGLTVVLFVAMNPYLYLDPIGRMAESLTAWDDWTVYQQIDRGFGLFTLHQKTTAVGHYSLLEESLPLSRLLGTVGLGTLGAWLTALCFAWGVVYLAGRCFPGLPATREGGPTETLDDRDRLDVAVVAAWAAVVLAGITPWLPMLWDRYLMPPYLAVCLATAIGLARLPRGLLSIGGLVVDRSRDRGAVRTAVGTLSAVGLWVVLVFTPWVMKPLLLPDPKAWVDADDMKDPHGNQALYLHHAGLLSRQFSMDKVAIEQFEGALSHLAGDPGDQPTEAAIRRCCILHDLAQAKLTVDDHAGAAEAFRQHIAAVGKLRDAMRSDDPHVRAAYDEIIAMSRRELKRLGQEAPDRRVEAAP